MVPATRLADVALQMDPGGPMGPMPGVDPVTALVWRAVGSFLTTVVVGAIMIALASGYTERMMADVRDEPVESFVYGFVAVLVVILAVVLFAITFVGIVVAIPLAIVAGLATAAGAAVAYLAIGEALVGREDGWAKPLLVGAGVAGALALVPLGGLVAFGISAAGFGAMLRDYFGDEADAETTGPGDDVAGDSGDPAADRLDR